MTQPGKAKPPMHRSSALPGYVEGIRPTPQPVERYLSYVRAVVVHLHGVPPQDIADELRRRYGPRCVLQWGDQ